MAAKLSPVGKSKSSPGKTTQARGPGSTSEIGQLRSAAFPGISLKSLLHAAGFTKVESRVTGAYLDAVLAIK
jgi:hypothetical protein